MSREPVSYLTVAARVRHEPEKTKGSRHIATIGPASDLAAVETFLAAVRAEFPSATHHAWAYRLGADGAAFRYSDDGEPSGSAGQPILRQIDGRGLTQVVAVVTRIFGGTKLGVGGLVRAYGGAVKEALERAEVVERILSEVVSLEFDYDDSGAVAGVLHAAQLEPRDQDYGARVSMAIDVPVDRCDALCRSLRDATGGRIELTREPRES